MSEPLLNVMKIMLLAGLYLFFIRVLWAVFSELRDPRTVARKRKNAVRSGPEGTVSAANGSLVIPASGSQQPSPEAMGGVAVAAAVAIGQLRVVEPPNDAGVTYSLGHEITLGRAPTNGIALDDNYVSTVHARIFLTNGTFFIEDLSSRNGSTLNGQALVATTALLPGDRLQLGATTMEFV